MLKEMPSYEQPREKLEANGVKALSNQELLAIILKSGVKGKSVMDLAKEILYNLPSLAHLSEMELIEMQKIHGIGKVKAMEIVSAIELGKRILSEKKTHLIFDKAADVFAYMQYEKYPQEHFWALYVDNKCQLILKKELFIGTNHQTLASPNEIFKWALKIGAPSVIIVHNHPSGDSFPSRSDIRMTKEIKRFGENVNVALLDHIIIGDEYYSFNEHNEL